MAILFITGGARSGKSKFAENKALAKGGNVIYIATAQALDEEMAERIKNHKERRPDNWITIEEPKYISKVLKKIRKEERYSNHDTILIDCLALLVSNWLPLEKAEDFNIWGELRQALLEEVKALTAEFPKLDKDIIIVSNEVGLGLVPEYPLGRLYRDLLGETNQIVAATADEVVLMVCGLPMKVK